MHNVSAPLHDIQTPSSGVGLFALDEEGFCLYASPTAEAILGFPPGGMLGFGWLDCIDGRGLLRFMIRYLEAVGRREALIHRCGTRSSQSAAVAELRLSPLHPTRSAACVIATVHGQAA